MSISAKRREAEVFSLAFLDCICCGFGAVILVFILTISQKSMADKADVDAARSRVRALQRDVSTSQADLDRLAKVLAAAQLELQDTNAKNTQDQLKLTDRQRELLLMLQQTGAMKDALNTLLGEKKNLPTDDQPTIPIPNVDRRQYLTGIRLNGEFVVFIVRISGSMLDETIDAAAARLSDSDSKKREAPKWERTVHALEWMIASLGPETHFQILFFNEETTPIIPSRGDEWFTTSDKKTLSEIVKQLHTVVPQGGANLERAFTTVRFLPRLPDSIVLLTDGLPTKSDSLPMEGDVGEEQRIRFFEIAVKQLPPRIPVSTVLFPLLSGDPGAPGLYWELANATRGALVSPSKSWPDT
ncbi:MAG TPA: vWA domain-containing protein [Opitutaceae bacterium]|nr:vWA domain-containing protein [Opitutaceae bacterium]